MSEKNLLVMIIDTNPIGWSINDLNNARKHSKQPLFTLNEFINSCVGFLNAYNAMSQQNAVALIAAHDTKAAYLYPSKDTQSDKKISPWVKCDQISEIDQQIRVNLDKLSTEGQSARSLTYNSMVTAAMGLALCYINRIQNTIASTETVNYRILTVQLYEDGSNQYMNFMNMIFAAEKLNVPIDSCVIAKDSSLLQQASSLTNGIYFKVPQINALLHYLLWLFLPNVSLRKLLVQPPKSQVDFRAACFCHRQLIDIGYVCSVCLSVFCSFTPICSTCDSNFQFDLNILKLGKRLNLKSRSQTGYDLQRSHSSSTNVTDSLLNENDFNSPMMHDHAKGDNDTGHTTNISTRIISAANSLATNQNQANLFGDFGEASNQDGGTYPGFNDSFDMLE